MAKWLRSYVATELHSYVATWLSGYVASVNSEFAIPRRGRGPHCLKAGQVRSGPPRWLTFCFIDGERHEVIQELGKNMFRNM